MNQNKLTFESENLIVDYISFNLPGSGSTESIAKYLFEKFNFNSTFARGQNTAENNWFYLPRNQHQVSFRQLEYEPSLKSFWQGTTLHFSGTNAAQFYKIIQSQEFDWNILKLKNASLGRIDLHYFRKSKITDQTQEVEHFMEKCCQRLRAKSKRRKADWQMESNGLVLRIGNRSSSNYYRVYQKSNGLQFELELKKELVKSFQKFLFNNHIKEFEDTLSKHFYRQSFESLNLNSPYMDWLLHWYRQVSDTQNLTGFITTYFNNQTIHQNKKLIFQFLRILSFIKNPKNVTITQTFQIEGENQGFMVIKFRLIDFLRHIKYNEKNHRQRIKMVEIFQEFQYLHQFQLKTFRTTLNDNLTLNDIQFTSVVMVPFFRIKKQKNVWNVTLLIANQFYDYNFPFQFNTYFLNWENTRQFEVKSQIIQLIAQTTLTKKIDLEEFLKSFGKLSNSKKTQIKKIFIEGIEQEIQNKSIQSKFKLIQKDDSIKYINKLTPRNLTKSKFIYIYEYINYKPLFK